MKKYFLIVITTLFVSSNLFADDIYINNGNIDCTDLVNLIYEYKYKNQVVISSPLETKKELKDVFIKEAELKISSYLDRMTTVTHQYVDKLCFDFNNILNEKKH